MHETVENRAYNALDETDVLLQTDSAMPPLHPDSRDLTDIHVLDPHERHPHERHPHEPRVLRTLPSAGRSEPTAPVAVDDVGRPRVMAAFRAWGPTSRTAVVAVAGVSVAYAFATFFARQLTTGGLSSATVAFARFALIALVLMPFVRLDRENRSATVWGLGSGAAMAVGWVAYVRAIDTGDVAVAGVIYMTYPLFTVAALAAVFRMRPSLRQLGGGLLVVLGAVVALGSGGGGDLPLVAFAAPATFGFSIAVLTERLVRLDPFERLGAVAVGASITLLPVLVALPADEVVPASVSSWLWIVGLGIGCALLPMLLYAACAPALGAARSAVAGSAELPIVFVIGAAFFGEAIRLQHLLAAGIIVVAIVVTPTTRTPHVQPDLDAHRRAESSPE